MSSITNINIMDNKMPNETLSFLQKLQEYGVLGYLWLLLLSFWAGTAKYLSSLNGDKPTFLGWLSETCVSGFVGVVAAMTCQYYQLDFMLTSAITGICAHNGTRSLYLIGELLKKNSPTLNVTAEIQPKANLRLSRKRGKNDE